MQPEAPELAYHPLPQFTEEQRHNLADKVIFGLSSRIHGLGRDELYFRIAGSASSDSVLSLSGDPERILDFLNPHKNSGLASFIGSVSASSDYPRETVEGMLAQLYVEIGLPRAIFGDKAHVIAFRGNEYGNNPSARELLGIDSHTAIVTKIVGGPKFRENLRLYYTWAKAVSPLVKQGASDEDILHAPLEYGPLAVEGQEPVTEAGPAFLLWLQDSASLGAYTSDQLQTIQSNPIALMRKLSVRYDLNQGRVMGSEWERDGRQAIQDEAETNYTAYMQEIVIPLIARGTNVYLLVSNFEGIEAGEDHRWKNVTLDVWAGIRGKNPATIKFDPLEEAQKHGVMMLNQNMLFATPDGKVVIASVPFFNLITKMDPTHLNHQFESWQQHIRKARQRGQHPILLLATHPYLPESEPWRGLKDPNKMPVSWSERTGGLTAKSLVGLGPELVQFAHTPDPRRGYTREVVDPNAYWVADPETTELRRKGEDVLFGDSHILHSPEGSTAVGVLYRYEPMSLSGSRTLPPIVLTHVQR